jgi:nucleotide-binding universal stress UspA family protein
MYKRILAAVNEHVNSEVAARYARQLAKTVGARLFLCSIAEKNRPENVFGLAQEAAKRLQHAARELGVETECIFDEGEPVRRIRDLVKLHGIDLVFSATRHEDVKRNFYAGPTISRRLLNALSCSVALVRIVHLGRISPREILVPLKNEIDHIPERAFFTAMLARAFESRVHLFHTARPVTQFFSGETHVTPLEWDTKTPSDISRYIDHLDDYKVVYERRTAPGVAGRSIAIEAASKKRDLIIMGASVRGLIDYVLRGNPMEYVLRETPCNLIILKPGR